MHIANALGVPVVAIFGPGDDGVVGPYQDGQGVVIDKNIVCRPCFDHCKFAQPHCLDEISVGQVLKKVDFCLKGDCL